MLLTLAPLRVTAFNLVCSAPLVDPVPIMFESLSLELFIVHFPKYSGVISTEYHSSAEEEVNSVVFVKSTSHIVLL